MKRIIVCFAVSVLCLSFGSVGAFADPWADEVISYSAGSNAVNGYDDPLTALGESSRHIPGAWGGNVSMFNAAWHTDQIVSIGAGGSLVVKFDELITDDANNPFGFDFLVFGNAFFGDDDYPNGLAGGVFAEPARISVSYDNTDWYDISGVYADDLFPTQGYVDTSSPYASDGTVESDFTKPVDPSIAWDGKTYSELLALYDGSGGGTGVDISSTGLSAIQYVKVWQDAGDTWSAEIDGFADVSEVPIPGAVWLLGSGLLGMAGLRRRAGKFKRV